MVGKLKTKYIGFISQRRNLLKNFIDKGIEIKISIMTLLFLLGKNEVKRNAKTRKKKQNVLFFFLDFCYENLTQNLNKGKLLYIIIHRKYVKKRGNDSTRLNAFN